MLGAASGWRRFPGHALGFGGAFFLTFYLPAQFGWLAPSLFLWLGSALIVLCVTLALEIRSTIRAKQTWGKMLIDLASKSLGVALGFLALWFWYDLPGQILDGILNLWWR